MGKQSFDDRQLEINTELDHYLIDKSKAHHQLL